MIKKFFLIFLLALALVQGAYAAGTGNITFFLEGVDIFPPNIEIVFPEDTTYTTDAGITNMDYTVSDNDQLDSCWYSLDLGETNVSITCGTNITGISSSVGSNTWYVYTNDSTGNTNSSSVTFTVQLPSSGGGGGGGGGGSTTVVRGATTVDSFKVSPTELNYFLEENSKEVQTIRVTNLVDEQTDVNISISGIRDFASLNVKQISLPPGSFRDVFLTVTAPEPGAYGGRIIFESGQTKKETLVLINVKSSGALFDVSLTIPQSFKLIFPGEDLKTFVSLLQVGTPNEVDVTIKYFVKDFDGSILFEDSETFFVFRSKSFVQDFLTSELEPGDYMAAIEVLYPGGIATSSAHFTVSSKKISRNLIIFLLLLIALIFLIFYIRARYKEKFELERDK